MNKLCYRIVFNASRSQLMAVAETACAHIRSATGQTEPKSFAPMVQRQQPREISGGLRTLVLAMALGLGLRAPLQAQIIADPSAPANQRPTVLSDGSRPLINIQTPSGAGVSRNTYSQFDVQSNGVILNNSRASNPWLATGEARIILNEVNSSNPSYLRGQVMVNGSNAQVVIVNPSGLKIDGARFVNASRATLSTGTPIIEGGVLKALQVERGVVDIYGSGLNAEGIPYTEILSRALTLSAQITASAAGVINVTTGAQSVDYATGSSTRRATASPAPTLAIDASVLGSMYAGRITLLATDAGVGVRNAGALQATSQLILTADGQLSNSGSMAAPLVSMGTVTGDIVQSGQVQASNAILLSAGGNVRLSGQGMSQTAGSAVVVSAQKGITLENNTSLGSAASGSRVTLSARETVQLTRGSSVVGQAGVTISSDAHLQASGTLLNSSGGNVTMLAGENLSVDNSQINATAIQLETGKALIETNAPIRLTSNSINASNTLTVLATGSLDSASNQLSAGGRLHMGAGQALNMQSDKLRAASLEMIGRGVIARNSDAAADSGSLRVSSSAGSVDISGTIDQTSKLSAGTDLTITALGGDVRLAAVASTADDIRINATGDTRVLGVVQQGFGKMTNRVMESTLNARKSLSLATVGTDKTLELGNARLQADTEDLNLSSAGSIALGNASLVAMRGSTSVVSAGGVSGVGNAALRAGQNLSVDAGQGHLTISPAQAARMSAGQDLSLRARSGQLVLDGWAGASATGASRVNLVARDLNLQGASVDLLGASLRASRDLRITATDGGVNITSLENTVSEGGYSNRYMQAAELNAGQNLFVTSAGHISAQGLKASAGADLRMQAASALQLTGTSDRLTRYDGFWTINQRMVNAGTLSAGGVMALSAGGDLLMDAIKAKASGALTINALGNVGLNASQNWTEMTGTTVRSSKRSKTVTYHLRESITTVPTELSAASVSLSAGNDLSTYGTRINSSSGRTDLQAGGAANYYAVYDQVNNRDDSRTTRSFLGIRYSSSRSSSSSIENTPLVTRLQSQAELTSRSGGDTWLQGTQVSAAGGYAFDAGVGERARADARIILEGVKTTVQQSRTAKSDYVVWQSQSGSGSTTQTVALPSFAGGGVFTAPGGLSVQIPEGDFKRQIQSLSAQPGMGYLNDLAARRDVNWQPVKLAHEQWNYSQSGLTPAGAALIGFAVAIATGGAGASLLGTTGTVSTAAANAAFTSLAAQASITLVNNKGDVGKTLKELGNSHTVKNMVIAAGVAGVTTYTADWGRTVLTETGNSVVSDWAKRSQAYLLNTAAKGVLTGADSGSDWWTVAALGLSGEAYQYWVGRGADVRPGVDRSDPVVDKLDKEGGLYRMTRVMVNGVLREGNNVGHNELCVSVMAICHGTPISNALNTLPGFNAFATLHDGWGEWLRQGERWSIATNLGSMPPALLVNYGALLDQYSYINARRR